MSMDVLVLMARGCGLDRMPGKLQLQADVKLKQGGRYLDMFGEHMTRRRYTDH